MGQRLVISITRNLGDKKKLAKIYYHWSGYTNSSLLEMEKIIDCLSEIENAEKLSDKEIQLKLIRYCEENGGGISGPDKEYIKKLFPKESFIEKGYSRNNGLIAISDKDQKDMQDWSEGDAEISINDRKCSNYVNYLISYDELKENGLKDNEIEKIQELPYDIEEFGWEDIRDVEDSIEPYFKNNGVIYATIE